MISLEKRIEAFVKTGGILRKTANQNLALSAESAYQKPAAQLEKLIVEAHHYNGWFTGEMVRHMILAIGESLHEENVDTWLAPYLSMFDHQVQQKTIAVVMAGNIPAVGFHDFLSVLMSGHKLIARLSSDDDKLLPAIADILVAIEPEFEELITFEDGKLNGFDAVIATGSDNTARYFEYYFGKYPHVIRKNRNGVAVLNGDESKEDLNCLADDIFLYFGLGCRNVSRIFVPLKYDFQKLLSVIEKRNGILENSKYFNNYEYNKAIYLINKTGHFDSANLLLVQNEQIASPVSVLNYEYYSDLHLLEKTLEAREMEIQCVVSNEGRLKKVIPFGSTQQPKLWDYADDVDTMRFLLKLD